MAHSHAFGDPAGLDSVMWRGSARLMEERSAQRRDTFAWEASQLAGIVIHAHEAGDEPCPDCCDDEPCSSLLHAQAIVQAWLEQEAAR